MNNKTVLETANAAISRGDHETFLTFCTDSVQWIFVGDRVLSGKEEVHRYLSETYKIPPKFDVDLMIAEEDYVTAVGKISLRENDKWTEYDYCDVWKFENGLMVELKAFVVEK